MQVQLPCLRLLCEHDKSHGTGYAHRVASMQPGRGWVGTNAGPLESRSKAYRPLPAIPLRTGLAVKPAKSAAQSSSSSGLVSLPRKLHSAQAAEGFMSGEKGYKLSKQNRNTSRNPAAAVRKPKCVILKKQSADELCQAHNHISSMAWHNALLIGIDGSVHGSVSRIQTCSRQSASFW